MNFIFRHTRLCGIVSIVVGALFALSGLQYLLIDFMTGVFQLLVGAGLVWLGLWLYRYNDRLNAKNKAANLRLQQYIKSLAPKNMESYTSVDINPNDVANNLGQGDRRVQYMFIDSDRVVTFPESKFGNDQGYYIIDVEFRPKYDRSINGNTTSRGVSGGHMNMSGTNSTSGFINRDGGFSGGGGFSGSGNFVGANVNNGTFNGHINENELPNDAYLTLVTKNKDRSFKLHLLGEVEAHVQMIKQYFLLNDFEQKQFNIK